MAAEKEGGQKEIQAEQQRHNRAMSEMQVQNATVCDLHYICCKSLPHSELSLLLTTTCPWVSRQQFRLILSGCCC